MWHSSLTEENRQDLERVQKAALKVILKQDYLNYEDALKLTNLPSLEERRQAIALRFAKNCLKNVNFSKLFPLKNPRHGMKVRDPLKYQIKKANTERFKGSSVIYMQKLLNEDHKKRRREMNDLNIKLSTSEKWIMNKSQYLQVNYVSNDYHCRK